MDRFARVENPVDGRGLVVSSGERRVMGSVHHRPGVDADAEPCLAVRRRLTWSTRRHTLVSESGVPDGDACLPACHRPPPLLSTGRRPPLQKKPGLRSTSSIYPAHRAGLPTALYRWGVFFLRDGRATPVTPAAAAKRFACLQSEGKMRPDRALCLDQVLPS